jgi:hypothetical protein
MIAFYFRMTGLRYKFSYLIIKKASGKMDDERPLCIDEEESRWFKRDLQLFYV